MTEGNASVRRVHAAERRVEVMRLRSQGEPFDSIADAVGWSESTCRRDARIMMAQLGDQAQANADKLRALLSVTLLESLGKAEAAFGRYIDQNAVVSVGDGQTVTGEPIDAKGAPLLREVRATVESLAGLWNLAPEARVHHRLEVVDEDRARRVLAEHGIELPEDA